MPSSECLDAEQGATVAIERKTDRWEIINISSGRCLPGGSGGRWVWI